MIAAIKPKLKEPFPNMPRYWECPKTGLLVPKREQENIEWREKLLREAENDTILQADLLAACKESLLYWINAFGWTYHQFDVDSVTGQRIESVSPHVPMITWERQDELFNKFEEHLKLGKDILIDKCRDMGASWCAVFFMHWLWLFHPKGPQLLELSRTEPYVDETGNMKALFQKHDKINEWLPEWMRPPDCLPGGKYRTKMHMLNILTGACIDGEATTEHAASGDRRLVALLDEFAKVKPGIGAKMRSATRDVAYMRIVNSTRPARARNTPSGKKTALSPCLHSTFGTIRKRALAVIWRKMTAAIGKFAARGSTMKYPSDLPEKWRRKSCIRTLNRATRSSQSRTSTGTGRFMLVTPMCGLLSI